MKLGSIEVIASVKKATFAEARGVAIQVVDENGAVVGHLVPIGAWIFVDTLVVDSMRMWRQRSMRMFLTQFESTFDKTLRYLRELSVEKNDRLLFLIYSDDYVLKGHIGISGAAGDSAELDNLMRGAAGGHPDLMYLSEMALIRWCARVANLKRLHLRALSYNELVIQLHERVGFRICERGPLKKIRRDDLVVHESCDSSDANVGYQLVKMTLRCDEVSQ